MENIAPQTSQSSSSTLPSVLLPDGIEIRVDPRFACLAAALTARSAATDSEHPLVASTREQLQRSAAHPAAQWLSDQVGKYWLFGFAMRVAQLGVAPQFAPSAPEAIPLFVQQDYPEPPLAEVSQHLTVFWQDGGVESLLTSQRALWEEVVEDIRRVLAPTDIIAFERLFWGHYDTHLVVVPFANASANGIGVSNLAETYATCFLRFADPFQANPHRILDLAQHEASHPILAKIQQRFPDVPDACAFIEETHAPGVRFTQIYDAHEARWTETLIRASTWFFLRELGRDDLAEAHLRIEDEAGVAACAAYVAALQPWWSERRAGRAPGLDAILDQFPAWLRA